MSRKGLNMNIFVYEYVTGGGCAGQPLPAFLADGELMWRALVADLTAIPGVEVITLRDQRLPPSPLPGAHIFTTRADTFTEDFRRCLDVSDAVLTVAPESGGVLESINRGVLLAGKRLLGSRPEAVHIAASKLATASHLAARGVATIPTYTSPYLMVRENSVVMKPDDGAGCQDTHLFASLEAAEEWTLAHTADGQVFQPYIAGVARSLSLLCCEGHAQLLAVNRQHVIQKDGRLEFHGVSVDDRVDTDGRYADLARRIAEAMPGLWGHVGVDFIETRLGPIVVEVNPRPTVSYAGLSAALGCNLARRLLDLPSFTPPRGCQSAQLEKTHVH